MFQKIKIYNWQQFGNVEIDLHKRLTILTGANGSGKTTILNILARHGNWDPPSLAVPQKNKKTGMMNFFTGWFFKEEEQEYSIGNIEYSENKKALLLIPRDSSAQYHIHFRDQQQVKCFLIPSHRSVFRYQPLNNIPIDSHNRQIAFQRVSQSVRTRYFGGNEHPTSFHIKELLIAWSIFGHGNQDMHPDDTLLAHYKGFENILKQVIPTSLGFKKLSIRNYEVILECETGDFMIDAASGGLSTLIDMAWQIFMFGGDNDKEFVVLIDEIENHLHPTMQRKILPDLLKAFPNVKFIVSTHAPLIISSSLDASVYVLRYIENKIHSQKLDFSKEAQTASQILEEVLGVSTTIPIWAEKNLESIIRRFGNGPLNEKTFSQFRKELTELGFGNHMPKALGDLLEYHDQNR